MVKKLIAIMLAFVFMLTAAYSYGGGGGGVIVFQPDEEVDENETFDVDTEVLDDVMSDIYIDCATNKLTYEGGEKDYNGACNFDWLELSKAKTIDVYIGTETFSVKTDEDGNSYTISIDGVEYTAKTGDIKYFDSAVEIDGVNETEEVNNETNVESESEEDEERGFFGTIFHWLYVIFVSWWAWW